MDLDDIQVPVGDWQLEQEAASARVWTNPIGDVMSLHFFDIEPDLPSGVDDLEPIRAHYRQQLGDSGAIVEVESQSICGVRCVRTVFKFPQEPTGMAYLGSLTLPFEKFSFVVKYQCLEQGITGLRDTAALMQHFDGEDIEGFPSGWFQDPYDPDHTASVLRNRSDDAQWDDAFPEHPLSRVRAYLRQAAEGIQLSSEVASAPQF